MTDVERVVAMYATGMSIKAIGRELGRSHQYAYRRLKQAGVTRRPKVGRGSEHCQWKGGRHVDPNGYVRVWAHGDPLAQGMLTRQGYAKEHRLMMAHAIGRPLLKSETVHHINGNKLDNRIENLQLRQGQHGKGVLLRCTQCGSHMVEAVALTERP